MLVVVLILALASVQGAWNHGHDNSDRPDGIVIDTLHPVAAPARCYDLCAKTAGCVVWTLDKKQHICTLKATKTPWVKSVGMVSGVMNSTLTPKAYTPLPTGSIIPQGWLASQLIVQAEGLSGHLQLFWEDIADSVWIGGPGDTGLHERGPYWLNGIVPLHSLLLNVIGDIEKLSKYQSTDDQICVNGTDSMYNDILPIPATVDSAEVCKEMCLNTPSCVGFVVDNCTFPQVTCWLKAAFNPTDANPCRCLGILHPPSPNLSVNLTEQMMTYINYIVANQSESGWLGPDDMQGDGNEYWARFNVLQSLTMYAEANPSLASFISNVIRRYVVEASERMVATPFGDTWSGARGQDFALSLYWLLDNDQAGGMEQQIWDIAEQTFNQTFDWEFWFNHLPTGPVNPDNCTLYTHGVNNGQALKSSAVWYRLGGNESYPPLSFSRMANMDFYQGQPTGMFGCDEHLAGTMPSRGTELCTVVETMFSYEYLFEVHGAVQFADRAEQIAYNALPATWADAANAGTMWNHQYLQQCNEINALIENDHVWATDGPDAIMYGLAPNYGCCTANFNQGWPKYASRIFMTTQDNGVAVAFYAPASTALPESIGGGATITVVTEYPYDDVATIVVMNNDPMPVYVRIPGWATNATVSVNTNLLSEVTAGTMLKVPVTAGQTTIVVNFNPVIRFETGYNGSLSVYRGPLLYSVPIGTNFTEIDFYAYESYDYVIAPTTAWNFGLKIGSSDPSSYMEFVRDGYQPDMNPFNKTSWPQFIVGAGRIVNEWGIAINAAAPPPASPVCLNEGDCGDEMQVVLVPHGATSLRISALPYYTAP